MTEKLRLEMGEAAIKAAEHIKYEGVGTVEFLVDKNSKFFFYNNIPYEGLINKIFIIT